MDALQKARHLTRHIPETGDTEMHAHNEKNEVNEISPPDSGGEGVNSLNSSLSSAENTAPAPSPAVAQLSQWLVSGQLDALPATIPDFPDDLAQYRDRTRLIAFARLILDCTPGSLTGEERATQFVAVLAPLISCGEAADAGKQA